MKAILEFNLPDEQAEHYCAIKGADMLNVLFEIEIKLRNLYKYEELNEDEWNMVEKIRALFYEILDRNDINLDK